MAMIHQHMQDCKFFLDNPFEDVHFFLDEFANLYPPIQYHEYHRTFHHNTYGLTVVEHKWGPTARKAALLHLYRDYIGGPITHIPLQAILERADARMPWWDNMEYADPTWYNLKGD